MRSEYAANILLATQASVAARLQPTAGEAMRYVQRSQLGFIARVMRIIVK